MPPSPGNLPKEPHVAMHLVHTRWCCCSKLDRDSREPIRSEGRARLTQADGKVGGCGRDHSDMAAGGGQVFQLQRRLDGNRTGQVSASAGPVSQHVMFPTWVPRRTHLVNLPHRVLGEQHHRRLGQEDWDAGRSGGAVGGKRPQNMKSTRLVLPSVETLCTQVRCLVSL